MKRILYVLICIIILSGCQKASEYPLEQVCSHDTKVKTSGEILFPNEIKWEVGSWLPIYLTSGETTVLIYISDKSIVFINEYGDLVSDPHTPYLQNRTNEFDPKQTAILTFHNEYRNEGSTITIIGNVHIEDDDCSIYVDRID